MGISSCIDKNSIPISALDRYNGRLYNVPNLRASVKQVYFRKDVYFLIMSGGYGIVTPSERIYYYKQRIDAKFWRQHGLPEVIKEYIKKNKITHAYGFFSRSTDYIKIMKSVDWFGLKKTSNLKMARTYYIYFQGSPRESQREVPRILGELVVNFIQSDFDQDNFYKIPFNGHPVCSIDHLT